MVSDPPPHVPGQDLAKIGAEGVYYQVAGWGQRLLAALVDATIVWLPLILLVFYLLAISHGSALGIVLSLIVGLMLWLAAWFHSALLMSRSGRANGQTWGRQLVGIRVVSSRGGALSWSQAFLYNFLSKGLFGLGGLLLTLLTLGLGVICPLLNWLWPLWDNQGQAWHDKLAKTYIVCA